MSPLPKRLIKAPGGDRGRWDVPSWDGTSRAARLPWDELVSSARCRQRHPRERQRGTGGRPHGGHAAAAPAVQGASKTGWKRVASRNKGKCRPGVPAPCRSHRTAAAPRTGARPRSALPGPRVAAKRESKCSLGGRGGWEAAGTAVATWKDACAGGRGRQRDARRPGPATTRTSGRGLGPRPLPLTTSRRRPRVPEKDRGCSVNADPPALQKRSRPQGRRRCTCRRAGERHAREEGPPSRQPRL